MVNVNFSSASSVKTSDIAAFSSAFRWSYFVGDAGLAPVPRVPPRGAQATAVNTSAAKIKWAKTFITLLRVDLYTTLGPKFLILFA